MALHIKSTTKFKFLIGFSALAISGVAALFSVTGVSSLFSGAFLPVVLMMSILEFGKIVVASYLSMYWFVLSKSLKTYFIVAVLVLMAITSAGIFGYLSDAYQKTKGDYTITESQVRVMESKKNFFIQRRDRLERDKQSEIRSKESNQVRFDSLTSRRNSVTTTRQDIKNNELRITSLENQISSIEDSIGYYDNKMIETSSINIKGELGPLKFIADAFGTTMDSVTKWLILLIIFVFDPLAVLLFVSLSTMIRQDAENKEPEHLSPSVEIKPEEPKKEIVPQYKYDKPIKRVRPVIQKKQSIKKKEELPEQKPVVGIMEELVPVEVIPQPVEEVSIPVEEISAPSISNVEIKEEPIANPSEESVISTDEPTDEPINQSEHEFYHGQKSTDEVPQDDKTITWMSSNSRFKYPK